jgi:hypothetical protein
VPQHNGAAAGQAYLDSGRLDLTQRHPPRGKGQRLSRLDVGGAPAPWSCDAAKLVSPHGARHQLKLQREWAMERTSCRRTDIDTLPCRSLYPSIKDAAAAGKTKRMFT